MNNPNIETLYDSTEAFPGAYWLETRGCFERYSNGGDEGAFLESAWFCMYCERIGHPDDGCGECST